MEPAMKKSENDQLIGALTESYNKQLALYRELHDLGQRILSQIVLSRGNLASVMPMFEQKQRILNDVDDHRRAALPMTEQWQRIKHEVARSAGTNALNDLLGRVEQAIGMFLADEDQLKRHLEHLMQTQGATET